MLKTLSTDFDAIRSREYKRNQRKQGLCYCGKITENKSRCTICLEKHKKDREDREDRRIIVLEAYGGKCVCCGESERKFLAIDHKYGNGSQHRFSVGGNKKSPIIRWLIKNNFPPEFQILCHNCNMAKAFYGICPHEAAKLGV